jgi:hypothetical protein
MRRLRGLAGLLLAAWLAGAAAAEEPPELPPGAPDVPSGDGAIRGRILHRARPEAAAGVPVVLYALAASGEAGLRSGGSDARGEFAFEGIASDSQIVYLVGARLGGIPFGTRVSFGPGERERRIELEISDPSPDAGVVVVGELRLRVERGCDGLVVRESVELRNPSDRVILVPEGARGAAPPILRLALPPGAGRLRSGLGAFEDGLALEAGDAVFWGPLHPGTRELDFLYALPGEAQELALERDLARGAERVLVLTPEGSEPAHGPGLADVGAVALEGETFQGRAIQALAPGAHVSLRVPVPARVPAEARLALAEVQLWLELDEAALVVDESHRLEISGQGPLVSHGEPLYCVSLPAGADALRFSTETLGLGLAEDPSGALALRGPLLPGESRVQLRYQVPVQDRQSFLLLRRFARHLPLLSVLLADTGVVPEAARLHRVRTVANADRSYLALEGFEIEPGEEVALRLRRTRPGLELPAAAEVGVVAAAALLALAFLGAPLRQRRPEAADEDRRELRRELDALGASLQDLEHDFETGKLAGEDHARLRAELRAQARALLEAERGTPAPSPAAAAPEAGAAPGSCTSCGGALPAAARFCPRCGTPLAAGPGAGGGGEP